jgi:hypothetical protein
MGGKPVATSPPSSGAQSLYAPMVQLTVEQPAKTVIFQGPANLFPLSE